MRPMSFEEGKQVELDILKVFAEFCEKHELRYFLAYGTLIGAVRHQGFIPWDDDIDLHMPHDDYRALIQLFNGEMTDSPLRLVAPEDEQAVHTFVKIIDTRTVKIESNIVYPGDCLGVDIDVFPLDGQPDSEQIHKKWYNKLKNLYTRILYRSLNIHYGGLKRRLGLLFFRVFDHKREELLKKADKLHALYPYETSCYVGCIESSFDVIRDRFKKECFSDYQTLTFEGFPFRVPCRYHEVLTALYGDYMQLPPEEERVTHHINNMFWKEKSDE